MPVEVLVMIMINIDDIPSMLSFIQTSIYVNSVLSSPSNEEFVFKQAALAHNSFLDMRICKTVQIDGKPIKPSWKRVCQIYSRIEENIKGGLTELSCTGTMHDPVRAFRNHIPPIFGMPVETFGNFMTGASIENGLACSITNWRDNPDGHIAAATICFDFARRKYKVIPQNRQPNVPMELPMYVGPKGTESVAWDFSDMTEIHFTKRVGDIMIMAGFIQPQNEFFIVARDPKKELWRIPSPMRSLNFIATSNLLIDISAYSRYIIYDLRTGQLLASGRAPFSCNSISSPLETHYIVLDSSTLYCITWDKLIRLTSGLRRDTRIKQSEWTRLGEIPVPSISSIPELTFFGHSFGLRYIALEFTGSADSRAYMLDLFNGTMAQFVFECPRIPDATAEQANGRTKIKTYGWTITMERSLFNEYGPRLLHRSFPDPRHTMSFWAVDEKGQIVFLSSLVLCQLGRMFCDRGGRDEVRFIDYL